MDRLAVFLAALAASAAVVGAAAHGLRGVPVMSFHAPVVRESPAPEPQPVALVPLRWLEEPETNGPSSAGPSRPEAPRSSFHPYPAPERPAAAGLARSAASAFRGRLDGSPPGDELAVGVAPRPRRAVAASIPEVTPEERPETPKIEVSPPPRGPLPPPPELKTGRLELPPPLAEELGR